MLNWLLIQLTKFKLFFLKISKQIFLSLQNTYHRSYFFFIRKIKSYIVKTWNNFLVFKNKIVDEFWDFWRITNFLPVNREDLVLLNLLFTKKNVYKLWYLPRHLNIIYLYFIRTVKKKILIPLHMLPLFKRSFFVFKTMRRAYWLEGKDYRPYSEKYWSRTVTKKLIEWNENNIVFFVLTSFLHFFFFFAFFYGFIFFHVAYQTIILFLFYIVKNITFPVFFLLYHVFSILPKRSYRGVFTYLITYLWYLLAFFIFFVTRYTGRYLAYGTVHCVYIWAKLYVLFWINLISFIFKVILFAVSVVVLAQDFIIYLTFCLPLLWKIISTNLIYLLTCISIERAFWYLLRIYTMHIEIMTDTIVLEDLWIVMLDFYDNGYSDLDVTIMIYSFYSIFYSLFVVFVTVIKLIKHIVLWVLLTIPNVYLYFSLTAGFMFMSFFSNFTNISFPWFLDYIFQTYVSGIFFMIFLLIISTVSLFFSGKLFFYKFYCNCFSVLFILSVILQFYPYSSTYVFLLDFTQTYIISSNFVMYFLFNYDFVYFSSTTIQIAFFVNLFSIYYMKGDQKYEKFILFLNYFVFSMVLLLHSSNFLLLFLFWELIGITSYFLINFYELKAVSFKSALKAFSFNRVSDVCVLTSAIIFWNTTGTFSINSTTLSLFVANSEIYSYSFGTISTISLFLLFITIASFCKSAQLGFHFWLPDSMEAPAPASALIHSATLVSAGLFLYIKFLPLYKFCPYINTFVFIIGSLTFLYGAVVSAVQTDLKRLLAYSTISNCGLLFVAATSSDLSVVLNMFQFHGLTKSLSFLYVGFLIILYNHNQDMRVIGTHNFTFKLVFLNFIISMSFLAGWFWSPSSSIKHYILVPFTHNYYSPLIKLLLLFASVFAVMYSLRSIIFFFFQIKKYLKIQSDLYSSVDLKSINKIIIMFFYFVLFMFFYKNLNIEISLIDLIDFKNLFFYSVLMWFSIFVSIFYLFFYVKSPLLTELFKKIMILLILLIILI